MSTSYLKKTVIAVAALALFPALAFAQAGSDTVKTPAAPAATVQTVAPAAKTDTVKTNVTKPAKTSMLVKHKHHRIAKNMKLKAKKLAKAGKTKRTAQLLKHHRMLKTAHLKAKTKVAKTNTAAATSKTAAVTTGGAAKTSATK